MWEDASQQQEPTPDSSPVKRQSAPQPQVVGVSTAASVAQRARSALAPAPPPVLPPLHGALPPNSSSYHALDADGSDYSDVGDYAADKDFYVPGVNDSNNPPTPLKSVLRQREGDVPALHPDAHIAHSPHPPATSDPLENHDHFDDDQSFDERSSEGVSEDADPDLHDPPVVRQHSNFSRLSAQSWLTVDSAQDVEVTEPAQPPPQPPPVSPLVTAPTRTPVFNKRFSTENDHEPAMLFGVDPDAQLINHIQQKPLRDMSVFECCAVLQAGVAAYKKKSFRRFGARRVWLSPGCDRLLWTSKKHGLPADHIKLQKVAKLKCAEREISIDVTEGYRISLLFANADEAGLWARALSCLIPLQARVRAPRAILPPDKEREDYNLADDTFNGRALREYMSVNSYVVICSSRAQPQSLGNKLAFSRSDASFCSLRYIPHKVVPLILRSQEEIAVLKRLDHPNIAKYHECLQDTEHGGNYVVFEHLARGTLIDSSRLEGVRPIPEKSARELIWDVVNALEYLHTLRIAHADVRPDNLLRAVDGTVKLNPLGCITHDFTEIKNVTALVTARLGDASPAFLAPELCWLSGAPEAHPKSYAMDVWAVGVVLYFMLYGRVPFGGRDDAAIQESICRGKLRFPRHPETSRKVRSLLKGVLGEKDPKTRIALSELKNHPWFTETEPDALEGAVGNTYDAVRLIVSPEEVDSAVQVAKVRVMSRK